MQATAPQLLRRRRASFLLRCFAMPATIALEQSEPRTWSSRTRDTVHPKPNEMCMAANQVVDACQYHRDWVQVVSRAPTARTRSVHNSQSPRACAVTNLPKKMDAPTRYARKGLGQ